MTHDAMERHGASEEDIEGFHDEGLHDHGLWYEQFARNLYIY